MNSLATSETNTDNGSSSYVNGHQITEDISPRTEGLRISPPPSPRLDSPHLIITPTANANETMSVSISLSLSGSSSPNTPSTPKSPRIHSAPGTPKRSTPTASPREVQKQARKGTFGVPPTFENSEQVAPTEAKIAKIGNSENGLPLNGHNEEERADIDTASEISNHGPITKIDEDEDMVLSESPNGTHHAVEPGKPAINKHLLGGAHGNGLRLTQSAEIPKGTRTGK